MKTRVTLTMIIFMAAIVWAQGAMRRINTTYIDSAFPNSCQNGATLPGNCTTINTGVICKTSNITFYQNGNCVTPYYKFP